MLNLLFLKGNAQSVILIFSILFYSILFFSMKLRSAQSIFIAIDSLQVRIQRQAFNLCLGAV